MWNATETAHKVISPVIPPALPNIWGVSITVLSLIITLRIIIECIRITSMNPVQFKRITQILPLSPMLLKCIRFTDLFIMQSQLYLLIGAYVSLSWWLWFCDEYEYVTANGNWVIDDISCESDSYCELHQDPLQCKSPSWTSSFGSCGIVLGLFAVSVVMIKCNSLCINYNQNNYKGATGKLLLYLTVWNTFFFMYMSIFSIVFGGPNINYVELHTVVSLMVLCLCHEVAMKYLYCTKHPGYNLDRHILFLLDVRFGTHLSKIIFDYVTDLKYANEGDEEKHTPLKNNEKHSPA